MNYEKEIMSGLAECMHFLYDNKDNDLIDYKASYRMMARVDYLQDLAKITSLKKLVKDFDETVIMPFDLEREWFPALQKFYDHFREVEKTLQYEGALEVICGSTVNTSGSGNTISITTFKKHVSFVPQLSLSDLQWEIRNRSDKEVNIEFEHPLDSAKDLVLPLKAGEVLLQTDIQNEADYGWITSGRSKLYINSDAPDDTLFVCLRDR